MKKKMTHILQICRIAFVAQILFPHLQLYKILCMRENSLSGKNNESSDYWKNQFLTLQKLIVDTVILKSLRQKTFFLHLRSFFRNSFKKTIWK